MAANIAPIFALTPNIGINQSILTANTTTDLTAGTIYLLATMGANGSWVDEMQLLPKGTNVASLILFWLNNGATTATAANNALFQQYVVLATTASNTLPQPLMSMRLMKAITAGWRIYATVRTGVAAGYDTVTWCGDY